MIYTENSKIETIGEVEGFLDYLVREKHLNFHPDDPFEAIEENGKAVISAEEAEIFNTLMDKCFTVCDKENIDIYGLVLDKIQASFNS